MLDKISKAYKKYTDPADPDNAAALKRNKKAAAGEDPTFPSPNRRAAPRKAPVQNELEGAGMLKKPKRAP